MVSAQTKNRLGFAVLGITVNVPYIVMLSAAYDLLNQLAQTDGEDAIELVTNTTSLTVAAATPYHEPFCHEHSTSTILLADTAPSLIIKLIYPFLLVSSRASYKVIAIALLATGALTITGLSYTQLPIFIGVMCASLTQGLGECTFLASTALYGDVSLSGWCIGAGLACFFSSLAYALLRMVLPIEHIMMMMLMMPITMLAAYFKVIVPEEADSDSVKPYGGSADLTIISSIKQQQPQQQAQPACLTYLPAPFNFMDKVRYLPTLAKYFLPLLLVYFAEYFINQGLFELIYYPEVGYLDHAAQYRWYQVFYQLGVLISSSSLDFVKFKNIWATSLLQLANAILFLAHVAKLIHLPNFYLTIILIVYGGLLGGLTYVNAFYRIKKEIPLARREFSLSTVTTADSLGIVAAALLAIPAHNALCKLYA